ncbi:MAG: glycosyltransferase, partial [Alphaproteobacteria bacterium]|nr:glycosyltransferase [Alphaproteobacteria bacterium]
AADVIFLPGNYHLVLNGQLRRADPRPIIVSKISNPPRPHWLPAFMGRWVVRRFSRAIDGLAAMNTGLARELRAMLPTIPVATLYDPVYIQHDTQFDHVTHHNGALNILWAGRLERQKDVFLALQVIQALNTRQPAQLTILGEGSQRARLMRAISTMGLSHIVNATGHVPNIDPYLQRADALLVTSHYEGGPAVAVEALAHGVPVVSTDCSAFLHDIMTVQDAGEIIPSRASQDLADALLRVTAADGSIERMKALVAHLDPTSCAQAYLDWFAMMLENKAHAH